MSEGFTLIERLTIPAYDDAGKVITGRLIIDHQKCNGCGVCAKVCPSKAIEIRGEGKAKRAWLEGELPQCMSCNDCAAICERDALSAIRSYDFGGYYKRVNRGSFSPPKAY